MTAWMKLALGLAVATVIAVIAATVVVGSKVREETVVARPYEEGLQQTCDLGAGPCTRSLSGGGEVTFDLGPRPLRTMTELSAVVTVRQGGAPVEPDVVTVSFAMPGMQMGRNEVRLARRGPGVFEGKAVLVRCPSGRRDWIAAVSVGRGVRQPDEVRFPLAAD